MLFVFNLLLSLIFFLTLQLHHDYRKCTLNSFNVLFKRALVVYIRNTLFLLLEPKCVFYAIKKNGAPKCKMSKTMESL